MLNPLFYWRAYAYICSKPRIMHSATKTLKLITLTLLSVLFMCSASDMYAQKKKVAKDGEKKNLRILYWNIQDGMWADQANNYDNFVKWVQEQDPDICVFCEASTIYATGTRDEIPLEERYLPDHWGELCARWGHTEWVKGPQRKSSGYKYGVCNYPQVVTSKYPIECVERFYGHKPDTVLVSGAAWHKVQVPGIEKPFNIVPIHAYAFRYARGIKAGSKAERDSLRKVSSARYDGEYQRIMEFKYTIDHSVKTSKDPDNEYWIMLGDFNSYSRHDNYKYKYNDASLGFAAQEFMNSHESPYFDIVAEMYPGVFQPSHKNTHRIDYVFVTKCLLNACAGVQCPRDEFCKPRKVEGHKYCLPSDHSPIIVDFKISKLK